MQRTARGATPLHTAAATGNFEVVEVLLRFPGVDVNAKNKDNKTPYDVASSNRKTQNIIARSGGLASSNQTGFGSRDEANAHPHPKHGCGGQPSGGDAVEGMQHAAFS